MKPNEKALEIFQKMKGFRVKNSHSKKCALICIEEILKYSENIGYWSSVKAEIEKL